MAQKVTVDWYSDLSKEKIASFEGKSPTVRFAYEGKQYELDLSDAEAAGLADALAPYIEVAREVKDKGGKKSAKNAGSQPSELDERRNAKLVRDWARTQDGIEVAERGRISQEVQALYDEAHAG